MNIENYNNTFPKWPPLLSTERWIYGIWMIGNDYRNKTNYYGAYPHGYLRRVKALFPNSQKICHVFSGTAEKGYWPNEISLDINPKLSPDIACDCTNIPIKDNTFDLVLADPPYSQADADKYSCKMPNRKKTLHEIYRILKPNGYCVWLDVMMPMYRRSEFEMVGSIGLLRSTNHRVRMIFIWKKIQQQSFQI